MRRFIVAILLSCIAVVDPAGAAAPTARELYQSGLQAYRDERYAEAAELFERAQALEPQAALAYNLARAREKQGNVAQAIASLREYLRLAPNAPDRSSVEAHIKELERQPSAGRQPVTLTSSPSGAALSIDGRAAGATPWHGLLVPGAHAIVLEQSGYHSVRRDLAVRDGVPTEAHLELSRVRAVPVSAPQPSPVQSAHSVIGVPTWLALGVGAGALGAALGFEIAKRSTEADVRNAPTQLEHQEHFEQAERQRDRARIFAGIGAAATVAGGVLLYLDLSSRPSVRSAESARKGAHLRLERAGSTLGFGSFGQSAFGLSSVGRF
jgi:tetratricopeptide (TPR) repeat protein